MLCAGALAAGWTATVCADGAAWFGHRGPPCLVGACLGPLACPGCGLLRATAAALQGDLRLAWAAHPAGPAVAMLLLCATFLHLHVLRRGREGPRHRRLRRLGHWSFVLALLCGWAIRLATA